MVKGYSGADRALAYLFNNATEVSFTQIQTSGTPIGTITIDGVSATIYQQASVGNVKDVLVDGVSVVDENGDAQLSSADFGTPVEANPVEPATDDLTTIKIGDTVYDLPSGGGSSYLASDFYSTDEEVVGSWTDDKPVYQKTISLSSLSAGANNVTITDLEHLVSSKSFIIHNNTDYLEVPYFGENYSSGVISEQACYVSSEAGKVVLFINTELLTDYTKAVLTVQYTKSTDAAGTAPTRNNLIYIPTLYSERERQVGVWTDGKPIYQRTWIFSSSISISYSSFTNTTIDSSNIENIVCVKALHDDGTCYEGIMADPTMSSHTLVGLQTTRNGDTASVKKLTLQYTKTTDQPGSGRWTPTGQYAHHYSTDEQIVGTWIDGSTLYEKTWSGLNINVGTDWTTTGITISNASKMIYAMGTRVNSTCCLCLNAIVQSGGVIKVSKDTSGYSSVDTITIQYTKSSS